MQVRALRRLYPTVKEMPIFVRASDDKHRRKLSASGATALETGPQESALLLGGAVLNSLGLPREEVVQLIDDTRLSMYSTRMSDIFGQEILDDGELISRPGGLRNLLTKSSPAEKAKKAEKAKEIAAEIELEIEEALAEAGEAVEGAADGEMEAIDRVLEEVADAEAPTPT